ncbi:hypothetical protein [Dysgonomonas massiliensis]|uniref:hypothetical protein n=1 Tax=Dysgonomonas massiliensis TaxID=2040292 RepID=UPI000C781307|nr:hypothetical protein [Dysgonomonas massiliensis]
MKTSISILTTLCIWFALSFSSFAQHTKREKTEIDFSFGSRMQMINPYSGKYKGFSENENYLLFSSSLNIPLMKGWRILLDLSYATDNRKADNNSLLETATIVGGYNPELFYIKSLYKDFDSDMAGVGIGMAYRFKFKRWSVEPRMGVGVLLFAQDDYYFTAKEKGSYQIYENRISFEDSYSYVPYLNAGVNINYYLLKDKFFIGAGINYQQTLKRSGLKLRKETWWKNEDDRENYTEEVEIHKGKLSSTLDVMVRIGFVFKNH